MAINFFEEDISFKLPAKALHKKWLKSLVVSEGYKVGELNFIFCSDEYLYQINVEYLNHNTYTDIITFDNSENEKDIEGDIFISIPRVQENAAVLESEFMLELRRVLAHGTLHLMGYKDKTKSEISEMRNKEEQSILLFQEV